MSPVRPPFSVSTRLHECSGLLSGFTILDNVTMLRGTFHIVTDDPTSMPSIETIGSSRANPNDPPRDIDWQILPAQAAPDKLGSFGGRYAFLPYSRSRFNSSDIHHLST